MSSLDGQSAWRDLSNRLDSKSKEDYFRLNLDIPGDGPAMDDVDRMDELRDAVHKSLGNGQKVRRIAFALLISSFFFELTSFPFFHGGRFYCSGVIRCRLSGRQIYGALKNISQSTYVFMMNNEVVGHLDFENDFCGHCHRYRKQVEFIVGQLANPITLYTQNIDHGKRPMSAFPRAVAWFIQQQRLEPGSTAAAANKSCKQCESIKRRVQLHSLMPKRKLTDRQWQEAAQKRQKHD